MKKKSDKGIINPTRKRIGALIIMALFSSFLWLLLLITNVVGTKQFETYLSNTAEDETWESFENEQERWSDGIVRTGDEIAMNIDSALEEYSKLCQIKADLAARAFFSTAAELGDACIAKTGTGAVIKVEDGVVTLPEGVRTGIKKYGFHFTKLKGQCDYPTKTMKGARRDKLVYSHIKGPYYYVEIINGYDMVDYINKYVNYIDMLEGVEDAYGVNIYAICPDRENSRYFYNLNTDLVYYPGKRYTITNGNELTSADFGLPHDEAGLEAYENRVTADTDGTAQLSSVLRMDSLDCTFLIISEDPNVINQVLDKTLIGVFVVLILTSTFIIWITSAYKELTAGVLTEKKKEIYSPSRIRVVAVCYGILGTIAVFACGVFFRSLSSIYQEIVDMQGTAGAIAYQVEIHKEYQQQKDDARRAFYLDFAGRVAGLVEENPDLNNKEDLAALDRIIGGEYIIIYDSDGKQISTSADYINMELGRDDVEKPLSSADFRRILKGVYGIAHKAFKDEITGRTLELYAVRTNDRQTGKYGVLVLAINPEDEVEKEFDRQVAIDSMMRSVTPMGRISVIVEPESNLICNASVEDLLYTYTTAEDFGIKKSMLRDGVTDFEKIGAEKHLCVSKKIENGDIIFLCTPNSVLFRRGFLYGEVCAIGFAILFALLYLYLIHEYDDSMVERIENAQEQEESGDAQRQQTGKRNRLASYWRHAIGNLTPEKKALRTFEVLLALFYISLFLDIRSSGGSRSQLVLSYVMAGKWNRGFNIFSLTSIVLLFSSLVLGMLFVRFVFNTLGKMLNSRGKTICRLISNLIGYVAILVFIYYSLSYLGVDTNAILASVGVIGIGVSMGARDLIADIFAGVSMIFEGEYQVGDIVNIDGYRGMVQEVGVRSTRLIGRGGNVKVIGNKDIKSVTNLTKMNSWVATTIKVDVNYPIRDAEDIINETLPKIGEKCPQIISGPYYKGILSVEMGFAVLSIIAECSEDDYHKVERILVREVLLALRENNVPVK